LVPEIGINLSRGCGNPTGFANLQPGEVVVDFGCGGGIDVILTPQELEAMASCPGEEFTPATAKEDLAVVQGNVVSIKFTATKL